MRTNFIFIFSALVSSFQLGCSSGGDGSAAVTNPVPSLVTIAKASLPSSLESSAVSLMAKPNKKMSLFSVDSNLTEVKDRLFSPGPTDFLYRLNSVDTRLDEIATNLANCENTDTTTYNPPAFITGLSFPMEFSCSTTIDAASMGISDFKVYYGKSGDYWYLAEFQTNASFASEDAEPPSMVVLSKVSADGTSFEVYQVSVEQKSSTDYATVMHILADKTANTFEISTASSADSTQVLTPGANFSGLGCGVQMRTDNSKVYASGMFSQAASCPSSATVCAAASDLSTTTGCGASVTSFETTAIGRSDVSGSNAKSMIIDRTGLPSF